MANTKHPAHRAPGGPDSPSRKTPASKSKTARAASPEDGAPDAALAPRQNSQKTIETEQKNQTLDQTLYVPKGQRWTRADGANITNADFPNGRWPEKVKPEPKIQAGAAPKGGDVEVIAESSSRPTRGTKPKPSNRAKPTGGAKPKAGSKKVTIAEPPEQPASPLKIKGKGPKAGPKGGGLSEATLVDIRVYRVQLQSVRDLLFTKKDEDPSVQAVLNKLDEAIWSEEDGFESLVGLNLGPDGDSPTTSPAKVSSSISKKAADGETQGAEVDGTAGDDGEEIAEDSNEAAESQIQEADANGTAEDDGAEMSDAPKKGGSPANSTRSRSNAPPQEGEPGPAGGSRPRGGSGSPKPSSKGKGKTTVTDNKRKSPTPGEGSDGLIDYHDFMNRDANGRPRKKSKR